MSARNAVTTTTAAAAVTTGPVATGDSSPARVGQGAIDVQWPDPSPLQSWWTEIMDGVSMPCPRRAA
ncbi:hypothetical protein AB0H42_01215 [Nocardia sp. NPDC050799]|uniref:hypothetical protein n=1 Tax=Nocardia sp. NPDC050799 TaxID=3154842 RepID=UPI0033F5B612